MEILEIQYNHEFISNKIRDELVLYDIFLYKKIEENIINEIEKKFFFRIEKNRNINKLSGGQRSIAYLITLCYIVEHKNIKNLQISLINILESLSIKNRETVLEALKDRGINVIEK